MTELPESAARKQPGARPGWELHFSDRLAHELARRGLLVPDSGKTQASPSGEKSSTDDNLAGPRKDALWQSPDSTVLARVPAVIPFEVATTDTSSLGTCSLCPSWSTVDAVLAIMRERAKVFDDAPVLAPCSGTCPECGKCPAVLGLAYAVEARLTNEQAWRDSLDRVPVPIVDERKKMTVCHTHEAGLRLKRSSGKHGNIVYTRLYDWHEYLGADTKWQYGKVDVYADYAPTVDRFFTALVGGVRFGVNGALAIARIITGITAFDSTVSEDERGYAPEERAVEEWDATLSDPALTDRESFPDLPDREALIAISFAYLPRTIMGDLRDTLSIEPGKVLKLSRAEALAMRCSDLIADLTWAVGTGWTKQEFLQARDILMGATGRAGSLLREVLVSQLLYNDISGYAADRATGNVNSIAMMEPSGATKGPLAEMEDAHMHLAQLAKMEGGLSGVMGEAARIGNGNSCLEWVATRYALLANAHEMQAPRDWQVASWWRWVDILDSGERRRAGSLDEDVREGNGMESLERKLSSWAQSCAWRAAPQKTDADVRERVYAELSELTNQVSSVDDIAILSARNVLDKLLRKVWTACMCTGTGPEYDDLNAAIGNLYDAMLRGLTRYSRVCTHETDYECCSHIAIDGAQIYAKMDAALGRITALTKSPGERLRHADYLTAAASIVLDSAYDSPVRAALWKYDSFVVSGRS